MTANPLLLVFGCFMIGPWAGANVAAPVPKEKPMLKCELTVTGKIGDLKRPDGGEVVITNTATETVDIGSTLGPRGSLDLKVRDLKGEDVKTEPLWTLLSPQSLQPKPHLLKSGESYRAPVSLLVMIPEEKRVPGTYKVKAVFTYQKKTYESAEVEVKWP